MCTQKISLLVCLKNTEKLATTNSNKRCIPANKWFTSHRQMRMFLETLYKATYTGYFKWSLHLASSLTSLATTTKKRQGGCRHFSIDNFRIRHSMLCGKHRLLLQGKDTLKTKGLLTKKPQWKECENIGEMILSIYIYTYALVASKKIGSCFEAGIDDSFYNILQLHPPEIFPGHPRFSL